jgi:hypothetical protein
MYMLSRCTFCTVSTTSWICATSLTNPNTAPVAYDFRALFATLVATEQAIWNAWMSVWTFAGPAIRHCAFAAPRAVSQQVAVALSSSHRGMLIRLASQIGMPGRPSSHSHGESLFCFLHLSIAVFCRFLHLRKAEHASETSRVTGMLCVASQLSSTKARCQRLLLPLLLQPASRTDSAPFRCMKRCCRCCCCCRRCC